MSDTEEDAVPSLPQDSGTRRQPHLYDTRNLQISDQQLPGQTPAQQEPTSERPFQTQNASPTQGAEGESYSLSHDVLKDIHQNLEIRSTSTVSQGESGKHPSFKMSELNSKQTTSSVSESNRILLIEDITDEDIIEYKPKMPEELRFDFLDAMIVFEDTDEKEVKRFLEFVKDRVVLKGSEKPKVNLYSEIGPPGMRPIAHLNFSLNRCTYTLLYITSSFCKKGWPQFSSEVCLMDAIENVEKNWSVVAIFTENPQKINYKIPPSICSLPRIHYWCEDDSCVVSLSKLLQDKLEIRKKDEDDQKYDRQKWVYIKKCEEACKAREKEMDIKHTQQNQHERELEHRRAMQEKEREQEKLLQPRLLFAQDEVNCNPSLRMHCNFESHNSMPNTSLYSSDIGRHINKVSTSPATLISQNIIESRPIPPLHLSSSMPHFSQGIPPQLSPCPSSPLDKRQMYKTLFTRSYSSLYSSHSQYGYDDPRYGIQEAALSSSMFGLHVSHPSMVSAQPYDIFGMQNNSVVPQQDSLPSISSAGHFPSAQAGMNALRCEGMSHPQSEEREYRIQQNSQSCQFLPALASQLQKTYSCCDTPSQTLTSFSSNSSLRSNLSDDLKQDLCSSVQVEQQIANRTDGTRRSQSVNQTLTLPQHLAATSQKILGEENGNYGERLQGVLPSGTTVKDSTNCQQQFERGPEKIGCDSLKESDTEEHTPQLSLTSHSMASSLGCSIDQKAADPRGQGSSAVLSAPVSDLPLLDYGLGPQAGISPHLQPAYINNTNQWYTPPLSQLIYNHGDGVPMQGIMPVPEQFTRHHYGPVQLGYFYNHPYRFPQQYLLDSSQNIRFSQAVEEVYHNNISPTTDIQSAEPVMVGNQIFVQNQVSKIKNREET